MTKETVQPTEEKVVSLEEKANEAKTEKQRKKEEAEAKKYWNTMISRKEAYELVSEVTGELNQRLSILMVQNRTLLEILDKKGVATSEEINELSKEIIEDVFGKPEDKQEDKQEGTENE